MTLEGPWVCSWEIAASKTAVVRKLFIISIPDCARRPVPSTTQSLHRKMVVLAFSGSGDEDGVGLLGMEGK